MDLDKYKKNMLMICGGLAVLFVIYWTCQVNKTRSAAWTERSPDPKEIQAKLAANEGYWRQASEALLNGDYAAASSNASMAGSFQYELYSMPTVEARPGLTAAAWYEQQKRAFASNVVLVFDRVVSNAVANPEMSHLFTDYYVRYRHEVPDLDKLYEYRKVEVATARKNAAGNWVRVVFSSNDNKLVQPLRTAITNSWDDKYGRKLVWGATLDDREKDATWMILDVNLGFEGASYELKGRYQQILSIQVPEKLVVNFTLRRPDKVVSTWDNLQNMMFAEQAPERIVAPETQMYERVREVAELYEKKLMARFAEKLKSFPKFVLFPGRDPAQTSLLKNGAVDHEAALVLSCLAPARLHAEAAAATWTLQPPHRAELAKVAIDHNVTSLVAWVTGVINVETDSARTSIWESLKKRPSYGSFDPLLMMVARAGDNEKKIALLKACKGYLSDAKVMNVIASFVNQHAMGNRGDLVSLLLTECPHNMLPSYLWLSADKDINVADIAIQIISRRDESLRWKMMVDYFDKWSPERKSAMLFNVHYNPREHGPEVLALFKKAAGRDQDPRVREQALHFLMYETAETPEGWKILDEIGKSETDPKTAAKIKEVLASAVSKADPALAETYLLNSITQGSPAERKQAAHKYFRGGSDIDAKLKAVMTVLPNYENEPGFFEALLRGFSEQGMSKLKDPSAQEFNTMMTMALANKDTMVRYFGIQLCHRAWSKGQTQYEPVLKSFMLTETNSWLLGQASNYHRSMQPPSSGRRK